MLGVGMQSVTSPILGRCYTWDEPEALGEIGNRGLAGCRYLPRYCSDTTRRVLPCRRAFEGHPYDSGELIRSDTTAIRIPS
jgi:hypothetical protein